jgi:hypothetical protein
MIKYMLTCVEQKANYQECADGVVEAIGASTAASVIRARVTLTFSPNIPANLLEQRQHRDAVL